MKTKRGNYNEILMSSLNEVTRKQVQNLFEEAKQADKVDEHGNWHFDSSFDSKGRGYAMNWDIYGIGRDYFNKRLMIVIQIRQWEKRYKNGFANVRKSYFLIGRNEDNSTFAHPVESRVIHNAIKKDADIIRACQDWIFQCDYTKIKRQGDLALIPVRKPFGEKQQGTELILQESHRLIAKEIYINGVIYAKQPELYHLPKTHPDLDENSGWYKVVVGKRGRFHEFALPTID